MTTSRWPRLAAASLLLLALPSCGGNDGIVDPSGPPTTLAPFVILQATFTALPANNFGGASITFGTPGAVRATMDWTLASNRMLLFVFAGTSCTTVDFGRFLDLGPSAVCTLLGSDVDPITKPAVVTFDVAAATGATVYILNLGPTPESGNVLVTLAR